MKRLITLYQSKSFRKLRVFHSEKLDDHMDDRKSSYRAFRILWLGHRCAEVFLKYKSGLDTFLDLQRRIQEEYEIGNMKFPIPEE